MTVTFGRGLGQWAAWISWLQARCATTAILSTTPGAVACCEAVADDRRLFRDSVAWPLRGALRAEGRRGEARWKSANSMSGERPWPLGPEILMFKDEDERRVKQLAPH